MGVTYKLKDEMVEFILQQKRDNPLLSCRGLVEVVQERFQTPVSKSSINTVIKNASLSNPIGRTPLGEGKPQKYKIPAEKKFIPPPPLSQHAQSTTLTHPETPKPKIKTKPASVVAESGKTNYWLLRSEKPLYDGMGSIFLKAAEWEISEKSILGNLLEDSLSGDQLTDIDTGCELLLYLELFGIKNLDELTYYQKQGLWVLHGLKNQLDPATLEKILQEVKDLKKLSLKISYEIPQIFAQVQAIRFLLEDGTSLYVDAELTSLWSDLNQACPAYVSLNQAIATVSKQLLNNSGPCIFCSAPGATAVAPEFEEMVMAFENSPGKRIKHIAVLDTQHQELAQFDTVPHQKRNFIAGVWPWQEEFAQLLSTETTGEKVTTIQPFKSKVYYSELAGMPPSFSNQHPLRAIVLRESPGAEPYLAIVTNAKPEGSPASEVVASYLSKWPNEMNTPHLHFVREPRGSQGRDLAVKDFGHLESNLFTLVYGIPGLWEIIHSVLLALNTFGQRHFFPSGYGNLDLETMREHFYGLSGHLWQEGNFLYAKLVPPGNYLYKEDLEYAMRRVNEKGIYDPRGRRLIFQF